MPFRPIFAALALIVPAVTPAAALELRLPADCTLGKDCFFQQFADMKDGSGAVDPYCGVATYDGHDGVDLRILSMQDIARGVPVVAAADGQVLRGRDGVEDRLVKTEAERAAIMPKACGNGVVIAHADGVETQYCHLRKGSIVVKPGQKLKAGDRIGDIGASGLVQFPHVHLTVRVNGTAVDPLTGRKVGSGCVTDPSQAKPLFSPSLLAGIKPLEPTILGLGMAGEVFEYGDLVVRGVPVTAASDDPSRIAWAWLANVSSGDRLHIALSGPDGQRVAENTTEPLDKNKAVYFSYAGKKGGPEPGSYRLQVAIIRDGKPLVTRTEDFKVE